MTCCRHLKNSTKKITAQQISFEATWKKKPYGRKRQTLSEARHEKVYEILQKKRGFFLEISVHMTNICPIHSGWRESMTGLVS